MALFGRTNIQQTIISFTLHHHHHHHLFVQTDRTHQHDHLTFSSWTGQQGTNSWPTYTVSRWWTGLETKEEDNFKGNCWQTPRYKVIWNGHPTSIRITDPSLNSLHRELKKFDFHTAYVRKRDQAHSRNHRLQERADIKFLNWTDDDWWRKWLLMWCACVYGCVFACIHFCTINLHNNLLAPIHNKYEMHGDLARLAYGWLVFNVPFQHK